MVAFPALLLAWPGPAAALDIQQLYDSLTGSCWSCSAFDQLVGLGLDLADQLFAGLAGQVRTLLGLFLAGWLLLLAARLLLPAGSEGGRIWNRAAVRLFRLAVVLALLQGSRGFWDYLFLPLLSAGAGLAGLLGSLGGDSACPVVPPGWGLAGAKAALRGIDCPLGLMQDNFSRGILAGVAMILGAGWHSWIDFLKVWEWPLHFVQILSGIVLALVYGFGFLVFPLMLVDLLLRATVAAVLSPLALGAALFVPTARFAWRVLRNLAHAALTLVFAAVAAAIAMAAQNYACGRLPTRLGMGVGDWRGLIAALEAGDLSLSVIDESYWILLTTGVLALFMLRKSAAIAAEFAETGLGPFNSPGRGMLPRRRWLRQGRGPDRPRPAQAGRSSTASSCSAGSSYGSTGGRAT